MNDSYDDGLVHSHGWAAEPPPSVGSLLRPSNGIATTIGDDTHDDGLVHDHGWACGERGRMAG